MSDRSVLLVKLLEPDEGEGDAAPGGVADTIPLGTASEVKELLLQFNMGEDGSPDGRGVLHGPGVIASLPMGDDRDQVMQLLVTMHDEDMAWAVLPRVCRTLGWKMMDPRTGRTFG